MINILYATVGTFLDTVVFNKSVYDLHKVSKRKRLQMYTLLYILLSILFAVVGDDIVLKNLFMFSIIAIVNHVKLGIRARNAYMYVTNYLVAFLIEVSGFVIITHTLGSSEMYFFVYTTVYKLILIKYLSVHPATTRLELIKQQILTLFAQTILVVCAIILKGVI